jgi:chromosome segregation ATPase
LQEKSAQISRLETRHIDPQYEKQISDLTGSLNEKNDVIGVLRGNLSTSEKELEFFDKKCNDLIKQRDETLQQIDDIKKRYLALENNHQRQAIQLQVNGESILKLENKLNLEENIRRNLENEIESMKTELTNYRTDIKNVTIERDNEISRLQNELKSKDIIVELGEIKPAQSVTYVTGNVQINRQTNKRTGKKLPKQHTRISSKE